MQARLSVHAKERLNKKQVEAHKAVDEWYDRKLLSHERNYQYSTAEDTQYRFHGGRSKMLSTTK